MNTGYSENPDFVPDPTAMTGTLETSGTGGGQHERLSGNVAAFQDPAEISRKVHEAIAARMTALREEVVPQILAEFGLTVETFGVQVSQVPVVVNDDTGAPADSEKSTDVATEGDEPETEEEGEESEPEEGDESSKEYLEKVTEAVESTVKPSTARKTTSRRQSTKK